MFEHSIYEPEPVAEPLHEGDLFYHYELPSWQLGPRIYKILGISAVANLLAFLVFTTTPILTMKGCDSPLAGGVCQVLDTLYIGSKIFGTERDYVDAVYDKTKIGDADITFVDVTSDTPPLDYPEGYFQIANPEQYAAMQAALNNPDMSAAGTVPGIPPGIALTTPDEGKSLFNTPQHVPKANPKAVEGDLPTGFGSGTVANNGSGRGRAMPGNPNSNAQPGKTPDPNATAEASPSPAPEDQAQQDKFGVYINKRPLKDQSLKTLTEIDAKQVKLDANFRVTVAGTLGLATDGKTVMLKNAKIVPDKNIKNDPAMQQFILDWISAVSSSGWLGYIEMLDKDHKIKNKQVQITVQQDDTDFYAIIRAQQPDENTANTASSGLNAILSIGAQTQQNADELAFLQSAKAGADKNFLVLNIHLPKPQVQEMVQRKLAEAKEPPTKPNSTSLSNSSASTTSRSL